MEVAVISLFVTVYVLSDYFSKDYRTQSSTTISTTTTEAILIAGGWGKDFAKLNSSEIYIPETGKTCSFPDLPESRWEHTIDTVGNTLVVCGGKNTQTSCKQFTPMTLSGVWTNYGTTIEGRRHHTSWVSSAGLVLVGGCGRRAVLTTTEIMPSGGGSFSLVEDTECLACAITDKESTIITGGGTAVTGNALKVVARYNLQGHVENLPEMNQGRFAHGCGSYYSGDTKVLIVAGGHNGWTYISSTEKLTIGGTAWTTVKPLPYSLAGQASVSMDNRVFIIGGMTMLPDKDILAFDGEDWKEVGQLQQARTNFAATKIDIDITGFCN